MSHAESLAMTRGHIALGGGGLGLFGTGCLWTWPSSVTSVQSRLCDQTQVDSTRLMDDSGYRGTVGGCVATTLGSVLHELGHTFDLGHTEAGIMARGFDDLDSLLTVMSERGGTRHLTSGRGQLTPCGQASRGPSPVPSSASILRSNSLSSSGGQSPRFTSIRRSDSVSKYLEEYSEKRMERRVETESQGDGGCHWTRSCALILAHQPWIRDHPGSLCPGEIQMSRHQIVACCRLAVVELRGKKGMVLSFWTPDPGSEEDAGDLELAGEMTVTVEHLDIVAMAVCGKIRKLGL